MSSSKQQENVREFKKPKDSKFNKKQFTWILSVVFLVLVVAVFVLSPLAGAFVPSSDSIVFGTYDGEPIEYAYGNYFYEQQQNIASGWDQEVSEDTYDWQIYQIWKQAFDNTVLHTAITLEAEKSGIEVTDSAVDAYLLEYGPYMDENNQFSAELYNASSATERASVRESVKETLTYQTVVRDIFSTLSSPKEIDYISAMADDQKSFSYVHFPLSDYPEERVISYAQNNLMKFTDLDISMITLSADDEEAAQAIYSKLENGEVLFEDAARNNSLDSFAEAGGEAGSFAFYEIASILPEEDDVHALFSVAPGSISRMYKTDYGYSIFRVNEAPALPDLTDEQVIAEAKNYLLQYENDLVTGYMEEAAAAFAEQAESTDLASAAAAAGLTIHEASAAPLNYDSSTFLQSLANTDMDQILSAAVTDTEALEALYSTEDGELSAPILLSSGYVLAVGQTVDQDETMAAALASYYAYIVQQLNQEQFTNTVFSSEKLTDDFLNVFFAEIMQNS